MASDEDDQLSVLPTPIILRVLGVLGVLGEHRGEACHSK